MLESSSTPLQTYNAVQASLFIGGVLQSLTKHELNKRIPQDFRDRIPDFRSKLNDIAKIEDDGLLVVRLQQLMDVYISVMESLEVEEQIYFNMIYQVSEYNNIQIELNSDDERSINSVSSDGKSDSDDETYYLEPPLLKEDQTKLIVELKKRWQNKVFEGEDSLQAYFNNFLETNTPDALHETEINYTCFKAISMVFTPNQVGIHRAIFEAKKKLIEAENKVEEALAKFKQEAQKLIDTGNVFDLYTKKELQEASKNFYDAKKVFNCAIVTDSYLSEMLEDGIDFDGVLSILDLQIFWLECESKALFNEACRTGLLALKLRVREEYREKVANIDEVNELRKRVEAFRNEKKEVIEVDSIVLQSFFESTLEGEEQRATTALSSCVSSEVDKIADITIVGLTTKMLVQSLPYSSVTK